MYSTTSSRTLTQTLWPTRTSFQTWVRGFVLVAAAVMLLTVSAKIQIPMWPVPMTMQTLAVLIVGAAFGWRLGGTAISSYLLVGLAGAPIFASGGGPGYLFGPTGGFLVGFLPAAMLIGYLAQQGWDRNPVQVAGLFLLGTVIIFAAGLIWLGAFLGWSGDVLESGLYPFAIGAIAKIAIGTALYPVAWTVTHRIRSGKKSEQDD